MERNLNKNSENNGCRKPRVNGWRCAAMFCGKRSVYNVGVFSWPNPDRSPERHKTWTRVVSFTRANFQYNKSSSFLCSDHFDGTQFESTNSMQRQMGITKKWKLGPGAVPTTSLFPPRHSPLSVMTSPVPDKTPKAPRSAFQKRERKRVRES